LGKNWKDEISTPALVINYDIMQKNIETMLKFTKENKVNLRPHTKTHKCPLIAKEHLEIAKRLNAENKGICVARVGEAEIFAQHGFDDILIANQVIEPNQMKRLIELNKSSSVKVCVDYEKNIVDLNNLASKENVKMEVVMEVDVGLGRNGVQPGEPALKIANFIKKQPNLELIGLQGYEGHLTAILDPELLKRKAEECMQKLVDTRDILNKNGFNIDYLTAGNTVSYKYSGKVDGITELQTGTYIFNDEHYYRVSPEFDMAVTILATVTNNPGNRYYTIDAGLKAATNDNGNPIFKDYPKCKIRVMTEEHSIFRASPKDQFEIGQKVELYPSHICTTVNLYDFFTVVKDGEIIAKWDILARGKNY